MCECVRLNFCGLRDMRAGVENRRMRVLSLCTVGNLQFHILAVSKTTPAVQREQKTKKAININKILSFDTGCMCVCVSLYWPPTRQYPFHIHGLLLLTYLLFIPSTLDV
ncbi:unnamed protein product [Ceratitis capitata]|uniref:(Mediterranean fruit fly) hypothetical protein n=1 Tax=Ceratitis capitata TaxID=7213 RepID=A0A811U083_CERCA|nr:unnamed protein product [Ceratitis capitata]